MNKVEEIKVPDIGTAEAVDVIEVLVAVGDAIEVDTPLVTLESDKASMDIPSPLSGTVIELKVKVGDQIGNGDLILLLEMADQPQVAVEEPRPVVHETAVLAPAAAAATGSGSEPGGLRSYQGTVNQRTQILVLGAGPGGYTAAFRAADLGQQVVLLDRNPTLGGVCLNVGCIPSKALLHAAKLLDDTRDFADHGIEFGTAKIDLDKLRSWKESVVSRLTGGLSGLAKQRKVEVVGGSGRFLDSYHVEVTNNSGDKTVIGFEKAIIAAGSEPVKLPFLPEDPRIVDSTGALELAGIPKRMLVIGGGIIGLEMATVYRALGSEITVVEMLDGLIPGADRDLVKPLQKVLAKRYENIWLETRVTGAEVQKSGLKVSFDGKNAPDEPQRFDLILVAVGRRPNGGLLDADQAGVSVDERGFIAADSQQRTNIEHIFAIGDLVGQPMLAHKAVHEGKVAAEVCAGMKSHFDAQVIPSVAYTDPEVAWVGLTETEAKAKGIAYGKGAFPWAASGRALSLGVDDGLTKLLFDEQTGKIIGGGIVGPHAGDLIAEVALAIENNCDAEDIGLTVHPHPTLSETVAMAAEAFEGTLTDLYLPKKK